MEACKHLPHFFFFSLPLAVFCCSELQWCELLTWRPLLLMVDFFSLLVMGPLGVTDIGCQAVCF